MMNATAKRTHNVSRIVIFSTRTGSLPPFGKSPLIMNKTGPFKQYEKTFLSSRLCEKEVRVVERLANKGELGGIHSRRAHKHWMRLERGGAKRRKGELGSLGATGTLVV